MLSRNLEQTLHRSLSFASDRRHEYATLEHLLLGLTDDSDCATVLRACGVDLDKLRQDLVEFLDKDLSGLTTERPTEPKPTAGFQRVVQRAAIHVQSSGRDEVTGANVLVAGSAVFKGGPAAYRSNIAAIRSAAALARGEAA